MAAQQGQKGQLPTPKDFKEVAIASTTVQSMKAGTPGSNNIVLPGCKILTANFLDSVTVEISRIELVNKYTASVVVSAKLKVQHSSDAGSSFKFEWKKLFMKKLMPNPHYAAGAESKFIISSDEFSTDPKNICALKVVLQQPSVQFTEFALDSLKVFTSPTAVVPTDSLTQWVLKNTGNDSSSRRASTIRDFPRIDKVSLALQKMWALGKKASNITYSHSQPKRFDKDGCYDINLLAY